MGKSVPSILYAFKLILLFPCFHSRDTENSAEQAAALNFFAEYAHDLPVFRDYLMLPGGLPLLAANIKKLGPDVEDLCTVLSAVSGFPWCLPPLADVELCHALVRLLMYVLFIDP